MSNPDSRMGEARVKPLEMRLGSEGHGQGWSTKVWVRSVTIITFELRLGLQGQGSG